VVKSFFLFRPFNKNFKRGVELIKRYYKDTNVYKFNNRKAINCARSLYNEVYYKEVFDGLDDKFKALLREYQGMDTDFETLEKEIESLYRIYDKTNFGIFDIMTDEMFNNALNDLKDNIEIIKNVLEEIKNTKSELEPLFIPKNFSLELSFSDILNNVNTYIDNIDIIDSFGRFVKLKEEMEKSEALSFLEWGIKNLIPTEDFASVFSNIFYTEWIYKYLEEIPLFSELNRDNHDNLVNKFKEEDLNHFKINELKIKEKLSSTKPTLDVVTPGSSVAILMHESEKKKRQKPIRKLLGDIRELALKLKPCFLMSPLSVSSYLDKGFKFDLVIFDEASQVFPWDALGAIYRSTQMIVVGDTKQMPPTNFFTTTVGLDLDIDDDVSLFESILDIASTKYPTLRLKWHYRSRHESLIAFSNKNFYDNELVSFPSAKIKTKGIGVDYYHVDGVFDRARHNNIKEAEKVVDLIWENIKTRPDKSMGVVAFSVAQQELIESGLIARRLADPSLEEYFSLDKKEPFFIKNLETVQGDERDIIIFSIGYGRDEEGKLLHNFGPINREGGERRLNVAVSRAKFNLEVVSSMHYYDIDLSKVSSKGARLLREYLQYAETGDLLISKDEKEEYLDIDYIVNDIDKFIRSKGYKTKKSIGYSHQKIDICVNELQSDDFKIAIEVDGTTYHASQNVRDRERLRENVLEKNGFIFYRIWSVDWFKDKDKEKTKLLDFLNSNLRGMGTIDFDSTIEILDYSETAEVSHFSFPRYDYYNLDAFQSDTPFMDNYFDYMMTLIKKEAPVSEAWVIKRVKNYLTKKDFEDSKSILIDKGAIFKDGFIHFKEIKYPILRESIPSDLRKLDYIPLEELSLGLLELIKRNYRATIEGVYISLLHCLGSRLTDKNRNYLNRALDLIKDKIIIEGEVVIYKE
ncbi:MAG: type III restriction endonuclease subunit R, partial [Bacilli bacterium]|nr:type III restriction endonuclease subunit R [Bacilli bacterium]